MSGPRPPADLKKRSPELVALSPGVSLHRFYTAAQEPIYFDRSTLGRFNDPDAAYGVLYAARDVAGAFAETFLRTPGRTLIDTDLHQLPRRPSGRAWGRALWAPGQQERQLFRQAGKQEGQASHDMRRRS